MAFVAPGLMVTTAMAVCAAESMWPVMGGLKWRRDYHGIAATPLDARDIVLGHVDLDGDPRRGITGARRGARPWRSSTTPAAGDSLPAVVVAMAVGVAFAMPIMAYSVGAEMDGGFPAIQRFVIIPLFLFGGAFYPLSQLPEVVQWFAERSRCGTAWWWRAGSPPATLRLGRRRRPPRPTCCCGP